MIQIETFLNSISKHLMHPFLWRITGFVSSIVGFSCYALSPSFHYLFGQWTPLKVVVYSIASSLFGFSMLFVKRCSRGCWRSLFLKSQIGFVVLTLTSMWSYLEERSEEGKAENRYGKIMNATSSGAFAMTAMSLSRQLQLGFEVGLSNFLIGCFMVTLMKMSFKLAPLAAFFCYFFINIRSISDFLLKMQPNGPAQQAWGPLFHQDTVELQSISDGLANYINEENFVDLEANSDVIEANSDVIPPDTVGERENVDLESNSNVVARDTVGERENVGLEANSDVSNSDTESLIKKESLESEGVGDDIRTLRNQRCKPRTRSSISKKGDRPYPDSDNRTPRRPEPALASELVDEDETQEWQAQVEPGVSISFVRLPNGMNALKRILFSKEMFNKWQAERWWGENCDRIVELFNVKRF